ncbi:MAG: hypothetical protein RLY78_2734 [Pseudomonadota bacterium]|jgi:acyl-CoA thioester hydrolase|uniref:Tol-pal system-associated acyl-CoA thioesterase n=1 Tax=Pseudaquabacterium rugosum TaxID=2984194 RepID=A0ABU9BDA2_9BURK
MSAERSGLPPGAADAPPVFTWDVRVYWEDTDAGGVVFYANYLKFFERARTEWLRALGIGQQALREASGAIFVVAETALRYRAPARLDDLLRITVQPVETGRVSMLLAQQAWRCHADGPATLLCDGTIRIGCVDAGTFRPRRFPSPLPELLSDR